MIFCYSQFCQTKFKSEDFLNSEHKVNELNSKHKEERYCDGAHDELREHQAVLNKLSTVKERLILLTNVLQPESIKQVKRLSDI